MLESFVSVDVETSGPSPGKHSLLAIGACLVFDPGEGFYVELQPDGSAVDPAAVAVSGLSIDSLTAAGAAPGEAMARFDGWLDQVAPPGAPPIFVALNAPFDWMFVCDYFHRYLGRNPFGHSALDIKALFMGVAGVPWSATSLRAMGSRLGLDIHLPHHALEDARIQARLFRAILDQQLKQDPDQGGTT